jgi:hypothetical protein
MTRWIVAIAVGLLMLCEMMLSVPLLFAQAPGGSFEQMSPGNQKGARALYEAQKPDLPPGKKPLTLDEIAARKQSGEGWTRIFQGMKSQGLIHADNFAQVVVAYDGHRQVTERFGDGRK